MTLRAFVKRWGSQEAAALELGFSRGQVNKWLKRKTRPRADSWAGLRANGITRI